VATVAMGDDNGRGSFELDRLEQGVDAHAAPAHVELRPLRDAADVDGPLAGRQGVELVPRPRHRLADQALDVEGPLIEWRSRGRPGREDGEVGRQVLARPGSGWPPRTQAGRPPPGPP